MPTNDLSPELPNSDDEYENEVDTVPTTPATRVQVKKFTVRLLALLCAMSLSIGSHYGSYILGPLKSRLSREIGTDNTEFSLLIAAFNLNSTWTPLVAGILASSLGTALSSVAATSIILAGQVILLFGNIWENVALMCLGLFVFGLGISPLAVVQETIVIRFFNNHGLGISLAIGLIAGKGASFVAARTSYPLSEIYGPHAPFVVSTLLALFSFVVNLVYLVGSAWLAKGAGIEFEAAEAEADKSPAAVHPISNSDTALERVVQKRKVRFADLTRLGDAFWAYIWINVLCGAIWNPFLHLAANIIQTRYKLDEADAGDRASYLLAGSLVLYPLCGLVTDRWKNGPIVHILFASSSILTMICYLWLVLPPEFTKTPTPAVVAYGLGHGFSTLLLVIIVPHIVPLMFVSTALGAHKSLEQSGATIFQTLAGLLLDRTKESDTHAEESAVQTLLNIFLFINILQFFSVLWLWRLDGQLKEQAARHVSVAEYQPLTASPIHEPDDLEESLVPPETVFEDASDDGDGPSDRIGRMGRAYQGSWSERPLLEPSRSRSISPATSRHSTRYLLSASEIILPPKRVNATGMARTKSERQRGKVFAAMSATLIVCAWVLFMGTAWFRMRSKSERKDG